MRLPQDLKGLADRHERRDDMDTQRAPTQAVKIGDLTPRSKDFNVKAKVLSIAPVKEVPGKFGDNKRVAEATIGDDTGNVVFSLWNEQIGQINEGESVLIENGYVTLVRGHIRLNVGKFGKMQRIDEEVAADPANKNVSDQEHAQERRSFGGGGYGGGRGGGGGYGGGDRRGGGGGYRDRDSGGRGGRY